MGKKVLTWNHSKGVFVKFMRQTLGTAQVFSKMWYYLQLSDIEGAEFRKLKRRFAQELFNHLRVKIVKGPQTLEIQGPAIYVCNHISYIDIPLMMRMIPEGSFVSKAEVAAWPLVGIAAKRIETIFVKREKKASRENVRRTLAEALMQQKKKIIIFPSSTTSIYKAEKWRKGVFEIAEEHNIPVIPVRLNYAPLRKMAYIDDDNFMVHLFNLFAHDNLQATIEFGEPRYIKNALADCAEIKEWCEAFMGVPEFGSENAPSLALET